MRIWSDNLQLQVHNLQLPCVQPLTFSYNFLLPHGCHCHHGRHGHVGHGGRVDHGGQAGLDRTGRDETGRDWTN